MKKIIILIILLWCGSLTTNAQSVPDSATGWSLQDVYDAVSQWAEVIDYPMTADLQSCFDAAEYIAEVYADNFDHYWYTYYYALYGAKNLLMFRNYAGSIVIPTVTTANITAGTTTADGGGNVTSGGGAPVTARGVCYSSTSSYPDISGPKTSDGTGTGTFTSHITGLTSGTTYNARAYATNIIGTAYGAVVTFTPGCRPGGLSTYTLYSVYNSVTVIGTMFCHTNWDYHGGTCTGFTVQGPAILTNDCQLYLGTGTDCSVPDAGDYILESGGVVYEVQVDASGHFFYYPC